MEFWEMDKDALHNYINERLLLGEEVHEDAIARLNELHDSERDADD